MLDKPIQPLFKQHLDPEPEAGELQLLKTLNMPPTSRALRNFTTVSLHSSSSPISEEALNNCSSRSSLPGTTDTCVPPAKQDSGLAPKPTHSHICLASPFSFLLLAYSEGTGRLKQEMVLCTKMILPSVWSFFRHTSCPL